MKNSLKKNKNIIAIIPARGGSKSIKNKNIIDLDGKPLIYYTINQALKSKEFTKVIVSTDSLSIAKIAEKYGAEVPFLRPKNISYDCPTEKVLIHASKYLEKYISFDGVACLQPTSPFRKIDSIKNCAKIFRSKKYDSVITFKKVEAERPEWMFKKKKKLMIPYINKKKINGKIIFGKNIARQLYEKLYKPNGSIYITKKDILYKYKSIYGFDLYGYINDEYESHDIDTNLDFEFSKFLIKSSKIT
jgi:N-acylneuraminate cytidylyltransferase/CMP-N,N'-diacetyllegionaminic acid synthase